MPLAAPVLPVGGPSAISLGYQSGAVCYPAAVTDSPNPTDPRVGSVVQGRYKVLDFVAAGGMAMVYRAERLQLGRSVAIKFLKPWMAAQPSFLQRFEVEARAMSRLSHPNCASVIDFGIEDVPFIVMDFVAGRSLRFLVENERLEPGRVVGITHQILAGLAHAHAQGIVHRDLKPENIIVSDTAGLVDHVRIMDFGLAKLHDGPALTVGMAIGTPSYMAPEQTLGDGAIDARTDIYAVGILLFEMLTGQKPFASENLAELIVMHQTQPPPRMSAAAGGASFSDALEALVAKALAKAPGDRFSTADEMAAALDQTPESTAMRAAPRVARPSRSHPTSQAREEGEEGVQHKVEDEANLEASVEANLEGKGAAPGDDTRDCAQASPTELDRTILDKTMAEPGRAEVPLATAGRPQQGGTPAWMSWLRRKHWSHWMRWMPVLRTYWRQLPRRQQLLAGAAVSSALVMILGGAFLLGYPKRHHTRTPAPAPTAAVAPSPAMMDELAPLVPDSTPGLADAAQLVRLGLRDQAVTVLQDIRRSYPRSAYANFLLAVIYLEKLWWSAGAQHAQAAMQADPAYRRSPKLARLMVHGLVSDAFWDRAADFLEHEMAEFSIPYLEEAAQFDKSPRVRGRANQILSSAPIERMRRAPNERRAM